MIVRKETSNHRDSLREIKPKERERWEKPILSDLKKNDRTGPGGNKPPNM